MTHAPTCTTAAFRLGLSRVSCGCGTRGVEGALAALVGGEALGTGDGDGKWRIWRIWRVCGFPYDSYTACIILILIQCYTYIIIDIIINMYIYVYIYIYNHMDVS